MISTVEMHWRLHQRSGRLIHACTCDTVVCQFLSVLSRWRPTVFPLPIASQITSTSVSPAFYSFHASFPPRQVLYFHVTSSVTHQENLHLHLVADHCLANSHSSFLCRFYEHYPRHAAVCKLWIGAPRAKPRKTHAKGLPKVSYLWLTNASPRFDQAFPVLLFSQRSIWPSSLSERPKNSENIYSFASILDGNDEVLIPADRL